MVKLNKVFVFSEDITAFSELVSGAGQLGSEVAALTVGTKEEAGRVAQYGVKTYWLGNHADDIPVENYTSAIAGVIRQERPNLILMKGTRRGKLIAGRLGVILKAGVVPDAIAFDVEDEGCLTVQRLVYGGTAVQTEKPVSDMAIALVGSGLFDAAQARGSAEIVAIEDVRIETRITRVETCSKKGEAVDLGLAKRVVSIGRGLAKQEDLAMVEDLASAIGAELACSRPIAEGEKWMPTERYIGVSGAMIKPDIYIALGISGQIQHMVGVNRARTIVAVNKDENAPIFNYADYGLVGDLYKVLPELTKLAQK